ncbi:MAG: hypothetical protein NVS9B15_08860 [Acidobacteriaceae bacterium]
MNEFEDIDLDLHSAFQRETAPRGLADRILARTSRKRRLFAPGTDLWRQPSLVWSLALLIFVSTAGSAAWHEHEQRIEGERAAQNVKLALRITAAQVQIAQSKLTPEPRP